MPPLAFVTTTCTATTALPIVGFVRKVFAVVTRGSTWRMATLFEAAVAAAWVKRTPAAPPTWVRLAPRAAAPVTWAWRSIVTWLFAPSPVFTALAGKLTVTTPAAKVTLVGANGPPLTTTCSATSPSLSASSGVRPAGKGMMTRPFVTVPSGIVTT